MSNQMHAENLESAREHIAMETYRWDLVLAWDEQEDLMTVTEKWKTC